MLSEAFLQVRMVQSVVFQDCHKTAVNMFIYHLFWTLLGYHSAGLIHTIVPFGKPKSLRNYNLGLNSGRLEFFLFGSGNWKYKLQSLKALRIKTPPRFFSYWLLMSLLRSQEQIHWIRFKVQLAQDPFPGHKKYYIFGEEYKNRQQRSDILLIQLSAFCNCRECLDQKWHFCVQ